MSINPMEDTIKEYNKLKVSTSTTNLSHKNEIDSLLKNAAESLHQDLSTHQKGLVEQGKKISITTVDDATYITKLIYPHFESMTKRKIQAIEDSYPMTVKTLFDVAFCFIEGSFGKRLQNIYASETVYTLPFNTVLILMLLFLSKSSVRETLVLPEIFESLKSDNVFKNKLEELKSVDLKLIESWILDSPVIPDESPLKVIFELCVFFDKLPIDSANIQTFLKLFYTFIHHLEHPSYLLIDLLIHKMHIMDRAIDTAFMIRNPIDRSISFELLINEFLLQHDIEKAMELWELIPSKQKKYQASIKIAESLIEEGKIEEAIKFSDETKEEENHDHLLREASLKIAKRHLLSKAREVIENIKDSDLKNYTQSSLVHILCGQFDFNNAKKVALSIPQADFKEDAILDIVKNYLTRRKYDDAINFTNSLSSVFEKQKPAKLIETALKIRHEDEKVHHVRNIFSLIKERKHILPPAA
jgi:hypothetical protein